MASNIRSPMLKWSYAPFYYIISMLNILLSLEFLADGVKYFGEAVAAAKGKTSDSEKKEEINA